MKKIIIMMFFVSALIGCRNEELFVEAESFSVKGGWQVDQQFMDVMGSPYLIAHGAGVPVEDASAQVRLPGKGEWHLFVRTFNWVSPWYDGEGPGKFKVAVDGDELSETLGAAGSKWMWQYAGSFETASRNISVALKDMTGFDGRCDALYFSRVKNPELPEDVAGMRELRSRLIRNFNVPSDKGQYDLVVAGGGVAGMCAAVAAARQGLKVALIHDRPVLGGNNSAEVRVHLGGSIECGPYPNLGNMIKEFGHTKKGNAKSAENYEDWKKMSFVENEENISLFLNTHVTDLEMKDGSIEALLARNIETGELMRFSAPVFSSIQVSYTGIIKTL